MIPNQNQKKIQKPTDTIVACATPAGYSSIGVIRISGESTIPIIRKVFTGNQPLENIQSHHAYYGNLVDPETRDLLDKVIITFYRAPNSYTGDDVVEIACHGNPMLIEKICSIIISQGARVAERGEFTRRSLLNGKIDLLQAEAVLDTIYAPCDEARKLAIAQYEGKLSDKMHEFRTRIIDLLVLVETHIDFGDDEGIEFEQEKIIQTISSLYEEAQQMVASIEVANKIKEGYKVLIMGRTNVGKSTLFNQLVGYDRAITHQEPGTTRDFIDDCVELAGILVRLYDTAGIINKPDGADEIAQQRTLELIQQSDLIVLLFDGSEAMNEQDIYLYDLTKKVSKILVVNKIDLNLKLNEESILSDSLKVSAKTGRNIDLLKRELRKKLLPAPLIKGTILTRQRHIQIVQDLVRLLDNARKAQTPETMAFELNAALNVISELSGRVLRKDVLDRIFDEFCIGK